MAKWELVPDDGGFELIRNGRRVIGLGGPREWAESQLREYREQERQARLALKTGDPLALCRLGWHRGPLPKPVARHVSVPGMYFRFAARIGEAGGTLIYWIASEPFQYLARSVKCLGDLEPWRCAVCEQPIESGTAVSPTETDEKS